MEKCHRKLESIYEKAHYVVVKKPKNLSYKVCLCYTTEQDIKLNILLSQLFFFKLRLVKLHQNATF